ncbi:hypothetical protein ALI22I_05470 [Saccharothrix sp. ALI-22-I]|nr:hypothetical protein ALI22I_05470 [Saccharothrix sp. ALI-22-I]
MTTDDRANRFDLQRLTVLVAELSKLLPAEAVPTVSAYMPKVLLAASPGQLRRYGGTGPAPWSPSVRSRSTR